VEIGGLMALGIRSVCVVEQPKIAILSSGDEVVSPEIVPSVGQVRDINSFSMSALIEQWGGVPIRYGIIPDNADALQKALYAALQECDGVVITAGSSASSRDITAKIIQEVGEPGVLVHGLNIRPGKPTILGICNGKPVVGLPGNPVSAMVIAWLVFPVLLAHLCGLRKDSVRDYQIARLTINVPSQAGREEWIPVHLSMENMKLEATPIFFKSSLIFNLAGADGLMYIPANANGLDAGEQVTIYKL
jgi:molybdopterin molybdotransferase